MKETKLNFNEKLKNILTNNKTNISQDAINQYIYEINKEIRKDIEINDINKINSHLQASKIILD